MDIHCLLLDYNNSHFMKNKIDSIRKFTKNTWQDSTFRDIDDIYHSTVTNTHFKKL